MQVSASLSFLNEYLRREGVTQVAFAEACGMAASNLSAILNRDTAVSGENIQKLLKGIRSKEAKLRMLAAYLRDEIPREFADEIAIQLVNDIGSDVSLVMEAPRRDAASVLLSAFNELPTTTLKAQVSLLARRLRDDEELRDLFTRMMSYISDGEDVSLEDYSAAPGEPKTRGRRVRVKQV